MLGDPALEGFGKPHVIEQLSEVIEQESCREYSPKDAGDAGPKKGSGRTRVRHGSANSTAMIQLGQLADDNGVWPHYEA